jgi:hypothetical protein
MRGTASCIVPPETRRSSIVVLLQKRRATWNNFSATEKRRKFFALSLIHWNVGGFRAKVLATTKSGGSFGIAVEMCWIS